MTDFSNTREYYTHDAQCTDADLMPVNEINGLRGCRGCAGVFKADGKTGVATTSLLFDEDRIPENVIVSEN